MIFMPDDRIFLDTNILVYANDRTEGEKQPVAIELVTGGIRNDNAVISTQVLSEFWVTVTQKIQIPLSPNIALEEIRNFRSMHVVGVDYDTVMLAIRNQRRFQLSYWDALILAAARVGACSKILSEDLNNGQVYDDLMVVNPFGKS